MTQLAPAQLKDLGTIARIQAEAFTRDSKKKATSIGKVAAAFIVFFIVGFFAILNKSLFLHDGVAVAVTAKKNRTRKILTGGLVLVLAIALFNLVYMTSPMAAQWLFYLMFCLVLWIIIGTLLIATQRRIEVSRQLSAKDMKQQDRQNSAASKRHQQESNQPVAVLENVARGHEAAPGSGVQTVAGVAEYLEEQGYVVSLIAQSPRHVKIYQSAGFSEQESRYMVRKTSLSN